MSAQSSTTVWVASGGRQATELLPAALTNANGIAGLTVNSPAATPLAVGGAAALDGGLQVTALAPFTRRHRTR